MPLLAIGLNYKSASLELRETLSLTPAECQTFLETIRHPHYQDTIYECTLISTCNRLEIYAVVEAIPPAAEKIIGLLSDLRQVAPAAFRSHLYQLQNEQAVDHLMRVATGLDSMVLGEPQILGQVVTAYQTALKHNAAQTILSRLLQMTIHAGKRARTETAIGQNPASVSSVAVRLARHHLGDLAEQVVMVLGAGEMGAQTVQALIKQGVKKILVVSRSQSSAEHLASVRQVIDRPNMEIEALTLAELPQALPQADVIITSTGAREPVLKKTMLAQMMALRAKRPLFIVDIGLPRDVEATIGDLPDVYLYNLDDLEKQIAGSLEERAQEVPFVEAIIAEEATTFWRWYRSRTIVPTITHFRDRFGQIKEQELNRTLKRLQHLDQRDQDLVMELAHRLVNKFLHHPTVHLKTEAGRGNGSPSAALVHNLFGLETK